MGLRASLTPSRPVLLALVLLAALLVVWVVFLTLAGTVKSHGPKHRAAKIVVAQR